MATNQLMTASARRPWRTVGAVVAGFLVTAVLSVVVDVILHATGFFPPVGQPVGDAQCAVATAYRLAFTVLGGHVTARLAPAAPMRHAWALGIIGTVLAIAGAAATWNGPAFGPHWYPIALVVTALPCVLAGARLWTAGQTRGAQAAQGS